MFPIVAWLVGLEYPACILSSSCESHTLIESLSTVIHFLGNDLLRPAQQLSTVSQPSTTPGSQTTELGLEFVSFSSNNQNIHTKVWAPPLEALKSCFNTARGDVKQVVQQGRMFEK